MEEELTVWLAFQVLLARHKAEEAFYAVKVLQKKAILKKKEVRVTPDGLVDNTLYPVVGAKLKFELASESLLFPRRSILCQSGMSC